MERLKIDSVDDCNKDLDAKIVRLSSALVGFVGGLLWSWCVVVGWVSLNCISRF